MVVVCGVCVVVVGGGGSVCGVRGVTSVSKLQGQVHSAWLVFFV
jgi:hypothetical protein